MTTVPVASVDVTPSTATIQVNAAVQLVAAVKDANGNPVDGATVAWVSLTPAVANVSARGYVVGLSAGTANITATSQGKSDTSVVTVQGSSGPPVLAGAGDIADCSRSSQEGTAKVLDGIVGQVATFGDGAYPDGSLSRAHRPATTSTITARRPARLDTMRTGEPRQAIPESATTATSLVRGTSS